jgi:phage terminase large subunit-like protein
VIETRTKRGRPPEAEDTLKRRGTFRKGRHAPKPPQGVVRVKRARQQVRDIERICREGIPGYDPWRDAKGFRFDPKRAADAVRWFNDRLAHVKGAKAREAFRLEKWQQAIIGNLYGWYENGVNHGLHVRRYRRALIYVPRKNGKTTLTAGVLLRGLFEDNEYGAEIYGAAYEFKQASLIFEHACGMIDLDPEFKDRCTVYGRTPTSQNRAVQLGPETGYSTYRVICGKPDQAHGFNTYMAVVDELHNQPDRQLVDALMTSTGAREQPLFVMITTADWMRDSICNEMFEYACKVRDGFEDARFLPVIYAADQDRDDWRDQDVWRRVNPNIGVSLSMDYLEQEFKRACEIPAYENTFKRLHLNMRTQSDVRWLSMDRWDECVDVSVDADALRGRRCYAGLDLSNTKDLTAFVLLFPGEGGTAAVLPFFWAPLEGARKRERIDKVPYTGWQKEGLIELTPGNVVDYRHVHRRIGEIAEHYEIIDIAVDPWNSQQLQQDLLADGFDVVPFRQGFVSMTDPTKKLEDMVLAKKIRHDGNRILRWCAANTVVDSDPAGNLKPTKKKSTDRIDGVVALIMAVGRMIAPKEAEYESVYKERGIVTI